MDFLSQGGNPLEASALIGPLALQAMAEREKELQASNSSSNTRKEKHNKKVKKARNARRQINNSNASGGKVSKTPPDVDGVDSETKRLEDEKSVEEWLSFINEGVTDKKTTSSEASKKVN